MVMEARSMSLPSVRPPIRCIPDATPMYRFLIGQPVVPSLGPARLTTPLISRADVSAAHEPGIATEHVGSPARQPGKKDSVPFLLAEQNHSRSCSSLAKCRPHILGARAVSEPPRRWGLSSEMRTSPCPGSGRRSSDWPADRPRRPPPPPA